MVIIRPTRKLRGSLPISAEEKGTSDTALGDWYVNRVVIDRRPLLLLVSSEALFAALIPARNVRALPDHIGEVVGQRLARLGVDGKVIDSEIRAMSPARVAKTSDRSVLGVMVDFAKMLPSVLDPGFSDHGDLMEAEEFLWDNPCYAGKTAREVVFPRKKARELLTGQWNAV